MKEKDRVRDELFELLKIYYNGSFLQMVCDYIRTTGMTPQEVEDCWKRCVKKKAHSCISKEKIVSLQMNQSIRLWIPIANAFRIG